MTDTVEWLLVVLLPVFLVSFVAQLVFVKVEARWRTAAETRSRLDHWIRTSERLRSIDDSAREQLEVERKDVHLSGSHRVLHVIRVRLCRLCIAWIRLRAWPGQYLNRSRYAEMQRNKSYISGRAQEYKRHKAAEWAALKRQLKTNVSLEALLGRNSRMVLLGIAITVAAGVLGWYLPVAVGGLGWYLPVAVGGLDWNPQAVDGLAIAIVALPMVVTFVFLRNSMAVYFSLGCAVVIYLGLSTLEVGPLGKTLLDEAVDAQRVTAMFVGVAIVLSLCQVLVQVGEKRIGQFEREVIEYAENATIWNRMLRLVRSAMPRGEAMWTFFAATVFVLAFFNFVLPLVQTTWLEDVEPYKDGVRAMVVATMAMLTFPFILLVRVERAWLVGLIAVGLVGAGVGLWMPWSNAGSPQAGALVTVYPVTRVDTAVLETQLSDEDRRVVTEVVLFDFDSASLKPEYYSLLLSKVEVLKRNEGVGLRLVGHTDDRGTDEVNDALGRARALAIRRFFADRGVDVGRVAYVSRGRSELEDTARSAEARKRNRRVEFIVTYDNERYVLVDTVTVMMVEADTTLGLEVRTVADTVVVVRTGGQRVGRSR